MKPVDAATVLVVDDDEGIRGALQDLLGDEGYAVMTACDGQEALAMLSGAPEVPRVILLDLMMPVMDGFRFLEKRKEDPRLASIPVIVMSAVSNFRRNAAILEVDAAFRKPLDLDKLLGAVQRCCA